MSRTVLIADDDALMVRSLGEILESDGWRVIACHDGRQAVEAVGREAVATVVIDSRMEGTDGLAALVEIGRLRPHVGVVLMSGYAPEHLLEEAERAGILHVLGWDGPSAAAHRIVTAGRGGRPAVLVDDAPERLEAVERAARDASFRVRRCADLSQAAAFLDGDGDSAENGVVILEAAPNDLGARAVVSLVLEAIPSPTFLFERPVGDPPTPASSAGVLRRRFLPKPFEPGALLRILREIG